MADRGWLWLLYVRAALLHCGWVGARLMIGYQALQYTSKPLLLGLVAATYAAPAIIAALPTGRLADRLGGAVVVLGGSVLGLLGCVASAFAHSYWVLLLAAAATGLGQLTSVVGQQVYVAERSAHERMDSAYGGLTSATSIGQLVGPLIVSYTASLGMSGISGPNVTLGLLTAAASIAIAIPMGVALARPGGRRRGIEPDRNMARVAAHLIRTPGMWRALIASGIVVASVDLLFAFMPAWAAEHNVTVVVVGWLLALRALATVASRLGMARLVERFGRRWLLVACLAVGGTAFALLGFTGVIGAIVLMVALGFALGLPQPLTLAWVVTRSPARMRGSALGLRVTSNRAFQVTLPILVGAVASPLGVTGIFLGTAGALVGTAVIALTSGSTLTDTSAPHDPVTDDPPPEAAPA